MSALPIWWIKFSAFAGHELSLYRVFKRFKEIVAESLDISQNLARRTVGRCPQRDPLAHRPPDLLILDINLPDTDGYALCQKLRKEEIWATLPILMLTVRRHPEEWRQGFSAGASSCNA